MKTFSAVYSHLRRQNRKQYGLLAGCCFFSVLLTTAYVSMMRSPTILNVPPEGGQLKGELLRELAVLTLGSCSAGAVLGAPLAWCLWQIFRLCVVDTEEMALTFDPQAYLLTLAFTIFVFAAFTILGNRSIRRTNIIDIVQESRKSEPIRNVPHWYGPAGILLLCLGGFLGYIMPSVFILGLHWYPPEGLTAIFYLPALAGLYMILLHTVVNGWSRKKHRYKDLIATSMMKFQGRQTVNNMLVMSLLIAGAYFASFYTPMLGTGAMMSYDARPVDYAYHYRADQHLPSEQEVRALADEYGVTITSWAEAPMARLAVDGYEHIEKDGPMGVTWEEQYIEIMQSKAFLSESAYNALTGQHVDLLPGQISGIMDASGDGQGVFGGNASLITNYVTGAQFFVSPSAEQRHDILFGRYVLDDSDYETMTAGLSPEWREGMVFFDVERCEETYDFAKALFNRIVDASGPYRQHQPCGEDAVFRRRLPHWL